MKQSYAINSFTGQHFFLSNFFPHLHVGDTVEHHFQAAKAVHDSERKWVLDAPTAKEAKWCGRVVTPRDDWEEIKDDVMLGFLRQKFSIPGMATLLLGTGNRRLIEGNNWGDRYWGKFNGEGENRLGLLLEKVREELRSDGYL